MNEPPPLSPYQAYLEESQAPIVSLLFTLPLFLAYHLGLYATKALSEASWVNGADRVLAELLQKMGLGGPAISMFFVTTVLLIWQNAAKKSWRVRAPTILLMVLESFIFAIPPLILGKAVYLLSAGGGEGVPLYLNLVLGLGAGVYEEFFFRMLLLSFLLFLFGTVFRMEDRRLYFCAILLQAVLFALFHHLPGSQEVIDFQSAEFWRKFLFRTLAGIYFAHLYHERGFGIAAGSHAAYDVIAILANALR